MDQMVEFITSIGFPMAFCLIVYMDSRKDKDKLYETLDKFGEKMDKFDGTLKGIDNRLNKLEERM